MLDQNLVADENRRLEQYENVKSQVGREVSAEVKEQSSQPSPAEAQQIERAASGLRERVVDEVVETHHEMEHSRTAARFSQVVDFAFYVIYALLGLRFILAMMGARSSAGFVQFLWSVTDIFYAPFRGIVASPSLDGGFVFALPILVALIVYVLCHAGINALLRMVVHRKVEV